MSALRNAVQRRPHRERAQPQHREKWGILEKPKDYKLRARDYNAKKARLRTLRQKASERNPDEFYFGMVRARVAKDGTRHGDKAHPILDQETSRLLKTQDASYLRTVGMKTRREAERLAAGFVIDDDGQGVDGATDVVVRPLLGAAEDAAGTHTVFVDSREEQDGFEPTDWFHTDDKGLTRRVNRPRVERGVETEDGDRNADSSMRPEDRHVANKLRKERLKRELRLRAVKERQEKLEAAQRELDRQRASMAKSATSVNATNKKGIKYKIRERKR
ncbi:MAG: hypothetical protein M1825_000453 [Sarcosagium campestre]|nr:MAG: hypothetical protein M1825_000453 [Sarcosagium campestre]